MIFFKCLDLSINNDSQTLRKQENFSKYVFMIWVIPLTVLFLICIVLVLYKQYKGQQKDILGPLWCKPIIFLAAFNSLLIAISVYVVNMKINYSANFSDKTQEFAYLSNNIMIAPEDNLFIFEDFAIKMNDSGIEYIEKYTKDAAYRFNLSNMSNLTAIPPENGELSRFISHETGLIYSMFDDGKIVIASGNTSITIVNGKIADILWKNLQIKHKNGILSY
jgi:hypothetical protein